MKVILHHFQTIELFSCQGRGCTNPLKNICTILMSRQRVYNPLEKYPYPTKCKASLKLKNYPVLILRKLLIFWKFPGPPYWTGYACHDAVKSKSRHSFNAFKAKFRCGLKKWKYLDLQLNNILKCLNWKDKFWV